MSTDKTGTLWVPGFHNMLGVREDGATVNFGGTEINVASLVSVSVEFPQTGIQIGEDDEQFELRGRTVSSATIGGVGYIRPTATNKSGAFDVMPNGTGSDVTGAAWIHVLDRDIGDAGADWQAAVLACLSTGEVRIGSHHGGSGTAYQPVKIGGTFVYFESQTYGSPDQYGYFRDLGLYLGRSGAEYGVFGLTDATLRSAYLLKWTSGAHIGTGTVDLGIHRSADGVLQISNGTPGTYRDLQLRNIDSVGGTIKTDTNVWINGGTNIALFLGSLNTALAADGTGLVAFRQGANAHALRVYYTFTDASNHQRGAINTGSDYTEFAAETAGTGADNLDVRLTPSGTGNVRFGTHSALAAETVSGYITIKDAAGNARKLAVVS